jgi:hypothetical protein
MDLIIVVGVLVLVGFLVWLLTTQVPLPPLWATSIQVFALLAALLYVLTRFVHLPNVLR